MILKHEEQPELKSFNLLQNKTRDKQSKIVILFCNQLSTYDIYK